MGENWAVIRLNGVPNKAKAGDMGIDGPLMLDGDNLAYALA